MLKGIALTIKGWFRGQAEAKHIAEQKRIAAEKAAWDAMTPKQREAIAIKNMWIAPCKDWSCLN